MPCRVCLFSRCQRRERERLFYIGNSWRSLLFFFFLGICHRVCYCLFESTWAELRGAVFVHFWDGAGIGTRCAREEKGKKKSSLSRAEDVFRFQGFFTQYGKVARFAQRKAGFQHSLLVTPFPFAARVSHYWSGSVEQWRGRRGSGLLRSAEQRVYAWLEWNPYITSSKRFASCCTALPYLPEGLEVNNSFPLNFVFPR